MKLGHQSAANLALRQSPPNTDRPRTTQSPAPDYLFSHKTDRIVASLASRQSSDSPRLATHSHNPSGRTSPRLPAHPRDKVDMLKSLLREKSMKIDDLTLENELLRNRSEVACRERDALAQDCQKLKARAVTLMGQLSEYRTKLLQYKDASLLSPSPEQQEKAQQYCDFIDLKLPDFPAFLKLFQDRADGAETFGQLLQAEDHFKALLVCLQVVADLMVMQSEDKESPREHSIQDFSDFPVSSIDATSRVPSFITRVEDEYEKMVDESRRLRLKIDHQSLRIATLSHQMALRLGSRTDAASTSQSDYEIPHREFSPRHRSPV